MFVYKKVEELQQELRNSIEYKEFKEAKELVNNEPGLQEKINEFEKIRYEEQLLALQGEEQSMAKMAKLQELYEMLIKEPKVKEYFDYPSRIGVLLNNL